MAPKLRVVRMERDDLAWEKSDEEAESWERSLHKSDLYRGVANLIQKYKAGDAVELHTPIRGGYNVFYRLEYRDGTSAAMKIPCKAVVKFPEEKTKYEVATMRYVAANTTIPVPKIYHYGTAAENPTGLGPFIIMDYIEHDRTLSHALNDPDLEPDDSHVMDANISDQKLEFLYRQMANIVLQLSTLSFPRIGSLVQDKDGAFSISGRPLIQNMNSLVEFAGVVPSLLPSQQYCTSTEWYADMADMHLAQITFQHNDVVVDEDDARDKYVARQLSPIAKPCFGCTLKTCVLIDKDLRVVGVIDWEFAYAAPASFSSDPPWWLLLKSPEYWPGGYDSWMEAYERRLNTFLRVLEEEEREMKAQNSSSCTKDTGAPLSQLMRRSWERKSWMINYAARNSWAFDFIFWRYLDGAYFRQNEGEDYQGRLDLLSKEETEAMEALVKIKMEERADRTLIQWDHDGAVAQMAKVMV
ncbi:Protein kinase-like protein [Metarhizium brunneum]